MSWLFSAPAPKSTHVFRFIVAGAFSLAAASCLGVLELDTYGEVPEELCSLYDRCYGPDAFVGCRRHVAGQLETADSNTQNDFLEKFADCLDDCQSASNCLDQPLFCIALRATCATNAQCCGFGAGEATCFQQSCCRVKDAPCATNADCCTGSCEGGKCNGSIEPVCTPNGAACSTSADCCSGTCTAGVCANPCSNQGAACSNNANCCSGLCTAGICSNPCSNQGAACSNNADCCTGICLGGVCSNPCSDRGSPCAANSDCCSDKCSNGTCRKFGCLAAGELCLSDADCCQDACDKGRGICGSMGCYGEGILCIQDGDCCNGLVCNPADKRCANLTCKKINDSCGGNGECCSLYCTNGTCQCAPIGTSCTPAEAYKCCSGVCENGACVDCRPAGMACSDDNQCCTGTCHNGSCCNNGCGHSLCTVGAPLSTNDCSPKSVGAGAAECVRTICAQDPACCCNQWDQSCVDKVASVCKLVCP